MKPKKILSRDQINKYMEQIRSLSNQAKYDEAYRLSKSLLNKYPKVLEFAYFEAVFTAEDDTGFTPAQIKIRYARAAKKLKVLVNKIRYFTPGLRGGIRNEYYWFSRQPYKQYRLGVSLVKRGQSRFYYSQGVGAIQIAKKYAEKGQQKLFLKWAIKSEKAWLQFFKHDSEWFNSYYFYALALGFQGRSEEMEKALKKMVKIAGKNLNWQLVKDLRLEIQRVLKLLK